MVAPKALPCVGCYYPLHHLGATWRCSALLHWGIHLWRSRSPFGRPLRHVCTRSGPRVPLLLLSAAASRLPASVLCVGVPVSVFCSAPSLCCPLSLILPPLIQGAFTVIWPLLVFLSLFSCLCPRLGVSVLCPVSALSLVVVLCLSCSGLSVVCCGASCLVCCVWVCLGK